MMMYKTDLNEKQVKFAEKHSMLYRLMEELKLKENPRIDKLFFELPVDWNLNYEKGLFGREWDLTFEGIQHQIDKSFLSVTAHEYMCGHERRWFKISVIYKGLTDHKGNSDETRFYILKYVNKIPEAGFEVAVKDEIKQCLELINNVMTEWPKLDK